jgi:hypothetical protein
MREREERRSSLETICKRKPPSLPDARGGVGMGLRLGLGVQLYKVRVRVRVRVAARHVTYNRGQ